MSDPVDPRFLACHAVARSWLERTLGVDLRRGGVARSVERHVSERLAGDRELSAEAYARALESPDSVCARALWIASTVTHSWLFRDLPQLEALRALMKARPRGPLSVWVAGCASGEEVYTVAALALSVGHDVKVLGTDVNAEALGRAARGTYDAWSAREVPAWAGAFLRPEGDGVRASEEVRARVSVRHRSLMEDPPPAPGTGGWDIVLCRNVLIYFGRERAQHIVARLAESLSPEGVLVLGASDVLPDTPASLAPLGDGARQLLRRAGGASPLDAPRARAKLEVPAVERDASRGGREGPQHAPPPREVLAPLAAPPAPVEPTRDELLASAIARVADEPADVDAHAAAGVLLHGRGEHERAIVHLRAAACLEPSAWSPWVFLGLAHERLGLWAEAHRAFRRALGAELGDLSLPRAPEALARELRGSRAQLLELAERRVRALDLVIMGDRR